MNTCVCVSARVSHGARGHVGVYATVCACAHLPSFFCTGMRVCLCVSVCVCVLAGACVLLRDCVCLLYILCVYLHVCMRHLRVLGKHMCIIFWFVCMCVCVSTRHCVCKRLFACTYASSRGLARSRRCVCVCVVCMCVCVCAAVVTDVSMQQALACV